MRDPRILLLSAPLQFPPGIVAKPDGSLGLLYLAGTLRAAGAEVDLLDGATGRDGEPLEDTFFRTELLPSGLIRVGLSDDEIVRRVAGYNLVGLSAVFTPQLGRVLALARALKQARPDQLLVAGGVTARSLPERLFAAGVDAICLTEGEGPLVEAVAAMTRRSGEKQGRVALAQVPGWVLPEGRTGRAPVVQDLDQLPFPAWDLLPNAQYWAIGRPHGGALAPGRRYASIMTSRGCPFACAYCHISQEKVEGSDTGPIGAFRVKSLGRIEQELAILKGLGVTHVYVEDDSLLAKKGRALALFDRLRAWRFTLADVNGVNIAHLYRPDGQGGLEPDDELLGSMAACGFEELSLPFESGSQRILNTYASRKWSLARMNTGALIARALEVGLQVSGNYTIGYPDETWEEVLQTLRMARTHMAQGLTEANVFLIVPFPGSTLFTFARQAGYLPDDWDPDTLWWFRATMVKTTVPPERLQITRELAWELLNGPDYVAAHRAVRR